ncbi:MAG: hypothetical protein B7X57_07405, partial [Erythrobacter sp. 34-65-8]
MEQPHSSADDSQYAFECTPGGLTPGTEVAAFRLFEACGCPLPVLIAAPHAGRCYPQDVLEAMRDSAWSILRLEDRLIDRVAHEVATRTGAGLLLADAPRAVIDLNRSPDDIDWDMVADGPVRTGRHLSASRRSRGGLGLVPRRLAGLGEIWKSRLAHEEIQRRMETVHRPYHQALGLALESLRDRWGAALLIDLHSMPPLKARFPDEPAPEFV